jgi:hypothetical protein
MIDEKGKIRSFTSFSDIADYLLASGVIVPPCKVGQTAHVVSRYFTGTWEIYDGKIDEITMYEKNTFIRIKAKGNFIFAENISEIGKCVFFTREEAEKALTERGKA